MNRGGGWQRGTVLVVALVVLLVMTLIGITSMQTVVLEEKMAGNLRDRNVAFQAAEAGLQAASSLIAGLGQAVDLEDLAFAEEGCGVVSDACVLPDKQTVRDEGTAYDALPNVEAGLEGVSAQPKVMISYRFVEDSGLAFGDVSRGKGTYFCTVGVLGVGVSEGASVMLQTTIPKRF